MQNQSGVEEAKNIGYPSSWVSHYTLSLFTIIYARNHLDRNIFTIVLQPIKQELAVARVHMRAIPNALFLFFGNLVGQTQGLLGIGYANDILKPSMGEPAIRYSLLLGPAFAVIAFVLIWMARRHVEEDIRNAVDLKLNSMIM